jgi:hypothetical protein
MEIYRKNYRVSTEAQAIALLAAQDEFINNPVIGRPAPILDEQLLNIWNGGEHLEWQWDEETQQEYDGRIAQETAEADELALLQSDNTHFKNVKIRPWRDLQLRGWIDDTFIKPLKYALTPTQETERINLRQELLDWPALVDFDSYKTDAEIDALKPNAPSWVS